MGAGHYAYNCYRGGRSWSWRGFVRSTVNGAVAGGMVASAYGLGSTATAMISTAVGSISGFFTNRLFGWF